MKKGVKTVFWQLLPALLLYGLCHGEAWAAELCDNNTGNISQTRFVSDMAERKVAVPRKISRIATIGSVPVLNSFVFALGEGDKIINGLSYFAASRRYKYQTVFAPALAHLPSLQNSSGLSVDIEALLKASPDVVFTMDLSTANLLEKRGFSVVFLAWRQSDDIKRLMRLVGQVLNRQKAANEYIRYFDGTVKRIRETVSRIPQRQRPKVLYCNVRSLTQPHLIAEWWIETAGGRSVTNNGRKMEAFPFSMEQLLSWDPDILLVSSPEDLKEVYGDRRFHSIKAVRSRRVYVVPLVAHLWANRTVEQPLTLLWAAKIFHPGPFKDVNLVKETGDFYGRFFHYRMSDQETQRILSRTY